MASTYTLNNGIELIGTGEQSGTWGDTTNTNFELVDTALDGQVSVTLASAGSSGSPNNLPVSDGATSNGRNRMVTFVDGGDLGATAYVQLTPNDSEKIIYVRNDLSGSRSVILFQGTYNASNDYEVPAGTTAVVYFDGAGSGAVAANVFNNAYFDSLRLGGVSVTAIIDDDSMGTASATNIATSESIKAYVDAQVGTADELSEVLANGNTTGGTDLAVSTGDNITFVDNSKAIFGTGGASSKLEIYSSGTNSHVKDNGAGSLLLQGDSLYLSNAAGSLTYFYGASSTGAAQLRYNNSPKLATTATGIDVTGTVTADGLEIDKGGIGETASFSGDDASGARALQIIASTSTNTGDTHSINSQSSTGVLKLATANNTTRMAVFPSGDIKFYETDGTTGSFLYDADAGTTFNEAGNDRDFRVESDTNANALFVDAGGNFVAMGNNAKSLVSAYSDQHGVGIDVQTGEVQISGDVTPLQLGRTSTAGGAGDFLIFRTESNVRGGISNTSANDLRIRSDSGKLKLGESVDYVMIDTTASNAAIQLVDNSQANPPTIRGNGPNFLIENGGVERVVIDGSGNTVFNDTGADADFRVESDGNAHMLFVDGAQNRVGIGRSVLSGGTGNAVVEGAVQISDTFGQIPLFLEGGANYSGLKIQRGATNNAGGCDSWNFTVRPSYSSGVAAGPDVSLLKANIAYQGQHEAVINEDGYDMDFRVESDAGPYAFYMDAGANSGYGRTKITSSALASNTSVVGGTSDTYINGLTIENNEGSYNNGGLALVNKFSWGYGSSIKWYNIYDGAGTGGTLGETNRIQSQYVSANNMDTVFYSMIDTLVTETLSLGASGTIFNDGGIDNDFRVESDTNTHALFVDAGANKVSVGFGSPQGVFSVQHSLNNSSDWWTNQKGAAYLQNLTGHTVIKFNNETGWDSKIVYNSSTSTGFSLFDRTSLQTSFQVYSNAIVLNEDSADRDFRVESDTNANAFFVDAGANNVCFGAGAASGATNMGYFHVLPNNCHLNVTNTQTSNLTACYYANRQSSDGHAMFFQRGGTSVGSIYVTGSSTAYNTSSDYRLKENVVYDWDATTRLKQLKPARFNFIVDADTTVDGFLAHEARAVVPEAVHGTHNQVDDDGVAVMQGIDQSKLVPLLVKTIQELEARITALENA